MNNPAFPSAKVFGEVVRDLRELQGIGVATLAERSGLACSTIDELEAGAREPSLSVMLAIADGLGVSMTALCRASEQRSTRARPS